MAYLFTKSKADFSSFFKTVFDRQFEEVFETERTSASKDSFTFVLSQGQEIVAAAACQRLYETLKINDLAVDPNLQKQGLGSLMLDHIKDYAVKEKIHTLILTTRSYQAKDFYLKNGFDQFGYLENMPFTGVGTYYMVHRLSQD
ncbi:GNAT family N-acetyltransferase [Streptococcus caprae]|uniref:GNAT family N-acetyltransferase n=1 Tax=Streptococcus caprae TaxID=1640501 RepID=A0ABV8CXJ7_9STRE